MNKPNPEHESTLEHLFNQHLVEPDNPDGIGPTVGEDVSPENERREDARYTGDAPSLKTPE